MADFSTCSTASGTWVSSSGDGAVRLAGSLSDTFDGPALNSTRWTWGTWSGGTYTPAPNGTLTIAASGGAFLRSRTSFSAGAVESTLSFGAAPWQHFGFGSDEFASGYLIFSTFNTSNRLFARVADGAGEQRLDLGPLPNGNHRYRVVWTAQSGPDAAQFYIDDVLKAQFSFSPPVAMYTYLSNNTPGTPLLADAIDMAPPYLASGTFVGCAFDAGASVAWTALSWVADTPTGTTVGAEVRTSPDGVNWSGWSAVTNGGAVSSPARRYLQYRLTLASSNAQLSPLVSSVTATNN